ncbi:MAG TPA: phage virion morphogenesis protein [bacterium]|nr:phage virion morphogenesis protein [bacterium]
MNELKFETRQVVEGLNRILANAQHTREALDVIGVYLVEMIRKTIRSEGGGSWTKSKAAAERGGQTLRSKGKFYNSFAYEIRDGEVVAGSNAVQARILYEGGDIRPVNKKFLTVPIHKLALGKRAGDFKNTYAVFGKSDKSTGVIMLDRGGKGEDLPIFALVKKVTIPGWDYLKVSETDVKRIQNIGVRHLLNIE